MSVYAYQITADSGCDLSLEKCAERGVMPYKMPFTMDGKPMTDGMTEESFREFYDLMRAGGIARTSQINPGEFTEFWRPLAEAGTPVLHISLAAAIDPPLSSVRVYHDALGATAVRRLSELITTPSQMHTHIAVGTSLELRESVL